MADLLGNDTDIEENKYYSAQLAFEAGVNPAIEKNKKSVFNTDTGTHEILLPMNGGGYIKIGEEGGKVDLPESILVEGMEFGPETREFQNYYAPEPQFRGIGPKDYYAPEPQFRGIGPKDYYAPEPQFRGIGPKDYYAAPEVMSEAPADFRGLARVIDPVEIQGAQNYAQSLQEQTGSYTMEDLNAAGYGADVVEAAGLVSPIEPMSQEEIAKIAEEGGSFIGAYDPTIREDGVALVTEMSIEAAEAQLREDLAASGADPRTIEEEVKAAMPQLRSEADILSNALFGTGNPLGMGVGDFVTLGVMDIQEGKRMFEQNRGPNGSVAGRAIGMAIMLAGVAEMTGVGLAAGKLLKKAAKKMQGPLARAGQAAQQRIDQEGSTLFSNPVGPLADRALAAGGRLVAPKQSEVDAARLAYEADPNNADLKNEYFNLRKQRDENPVESFEPPTEESPGLIVFHGSGADFDEFKIDKINTGEGAQAYGYGLYFTDSEDIASFYKSAVRQSQDLRSGYEVSYKGKEIKNLGDTAEAELANMEYFAVSGIIDNLPKVTTMQTKDLPQSELIQLAKDMKIKALNGAIERAGSDELSELIVDSLQQQLKATEAIDPSDLSVAEGKTYQVNVGVKPDELLDFDKPLEEQSPLVQQAVAKTFYEMTEDDAANFGFETVAEAQPYLTQGFTAQRFLNDWSNVRGSDDAGEKLLAQHGVKGIKYKANRGSRDAPKEGPNNYVIFDDKLITIMKKYGIVGPVALTGLTAQGENTEGASNGI